MSVEMIARKFTRMAGPLLARRLQNDKYPGSKSTGWWDPCFLYEAGTLFSHCSEGAPAELAGGEQATHSARSGPPTADRQN